MWRKVALTLLLMQGICGCQTPAIPTPAAEMAIQNSTVRVILALRSGYNLASILSPQDHIKSRFEPRSGLFGLTLATEQDAFRLIRRLQTHPGVRFIEKDTPILPPQYTLDETADSPPYLTGFELQMLPTALLTSQWNIRAGKIDQAWKYQGKSPITVAVIDSGVDPEHPDLKNLLLPLEDVWQDTVGSDILQGRNSRLRIDFAGRDGNGHGTHVAGIIAATLQQIQPEQNRDIRILPIKATSMEGATSALILAAAIQRAIDKNARIINMSIGSVGDLSSGGLEVLKAMIELAQSKGIIVISATGNESFRLRDRVSPVSFPAAFPEVIAVGALTASDKVANYSNGGPEIDLLAPGGSSNARLDDGEGIWSTWPTYRTYEFFRRNVPSLNYAATSGTSMAAPHVTGVAALLLSREPELTPAQVRQRLIVTADDMLEPGFDPMSGFGKLNAERALQWSSHDGG